METLTAYDKISLVVPIRDEEETIVDLINSILRQTLRPDEVVLVDGGSNDRTIVLVEGLMHDVAVSDGLTIQLIKTDGASPGMGRNIGIAAARHDWIALTDAGIRLDEKWLEGMFDVVVNEPSIDIVYGYVDTVIESNFDKCATLAYIPPPDENGIRRSIASSLLRKHVWKVVGGFPDLRAEEDLIFMDAAEKQFRIGYAPKAVVHWKLRPDLASTYRKFVLYSKANVLAGRQRFWHYGVLKQYAVLLLIAALAVIFSWWILLVGVGWVFARTLKRILLNRELFGLIPLIQPQIFFGTMVVILTIDVATFVGWAAARRASTGRFASPS